MEYTITRRQLADWCSIPHEELFEHPERKVENIRMYPTKAETFEYIGNLMAEEIIANNQAGKITRWILPAGPLKQYDTFCRRVNKERISLKNLYVFHMDEWLDWQGRPYPVQYAYNSLRGIMLHDFYGRIDEELNVPEDHRIWPDVHDVDAYDRKVEELGGIDTVWAGIGCKGLIAFCEAPRDPYHLITLEEFAASKTRFVHINPDTTVALSEREAGGCYDAIPPMAITLGLSSILTARRIVFMITTGSWKQTVIRVMLFSEPTLEYPVTLLVDRIPEKILCCDAATITHPMETDNQFYQAELRR